MVPSNIKLGFLFELTLNSKETGILRDKTMDDK